jgi:hypothetical protein
MTSEIRVDRILPLSGTGSVDITASLASTAATASMVLGSIQSASYAATASVALNAGVSASYALTASYASNASAADWNTLLNKPVGIVSSSVQVNTGSFTGSLTGSATIAVSASYALTSSYTRLPTGVVSSSIQINTGSFSGSLTGAIQGTITSASYASTASLLLGSIQSASFATSCYTASYFSGAIDFNNGLVVTGSTISTLGFTGSLRGTASVAITASYASNAGGVSSSYALTSSYATVAQNVLGSITSASYSSYAVTASYFSGTADFFNGLIVTGSTISTLGFTGSLQGSSSYALSASYALNGGGSGVSSSYATTSSYASTAATASYITGGITFNNGLTVTGSFVINTSGTQVLTPTILSNPLAIASITASLPFTKVYTTSSTEPTIQIPTPTYTGSLFEFIYSNFSAGQRTVQFQNVRKSDNALTDFSCSVAQSASLYVKLCYLPQSGLSPAGVKYMVMFTQSIV